MEGVREGGLRDERIFRLLTAGGHDVGREPMETGRRIVGVALSGRGLSRFWVDLLYVVVSYLRQQSVYVCVLLLLDPRCKL